MKVSYNTIVHLISLSSWPLLGGGLNVQTRTDTKVPRSRVYFLKINKINMSILSSFYAFE